jgi:hypothetical protein
MAKPDCPLSPDQLQALEAYLKDLMEPFDTVHCDSNRQICFDAEGLWGLVYDGQFYTSVPLAQLPAQLSTHCDRCSQEWEKLQGIHS